MKCPVCNVDLNMSERQGIEIDYCPQCRGIWLDRGELDKIIERSGPGREADEQPQESRHGEDSDRGDRGGRDRKDDDREDAGRRKKGRGSFLGDLLGGIGGD